jgi:hypothetical protein
VTTLDSKTFTGVHSDTIPNACASPSEMQALIIDRSPCREDFRYALMNGSQGSGQIASRFIGCAPFLIVA